MAPAPRSPPPARNTRPGGLADPSFADKPHGRRQRVRGRRSALAHPTTRDRFSQPLPGCPRGPPASGRGVVPDPAGALPRREPMMTTRPHRPTPTLRRARCAGRAFVLDQERCGPAARHRRACGSPRPCSRTVPAGRRSASPPGRPHRRRRRGTQVGGEFAHGASIWRRHRPGGGRGGGATWQRDRAHAGQLP